MNKEFTRKEFNQFVEKNDLEVFSSNQVIAFSKDLIQKSQNNEIDEFEKNCAAADYQSLEKAVVVEDDLTKSVVFYRPNQFEVVDIPDGIFKSIDSKAYRKYKETPLNIFKGLAGINCADEDAIEKAKALPIGTEKTYGGKLYIKTEQGWRPKTISAETYKKRSDRQIEEKRQELLRLREREKLLNETAKEKKIPSTITVDQKTFHIKDGKISASESEPLSRKNKLCNYAQENDLEIKWIESENTLKTNDYIRKYKEALHKTISLEKELFDAEEKSKDNDTLPLDKLKKTEWYKNQLDKIKESKEDFDKIKSEIPKELDKEVLKRRIKMFEDDKDFAETRVNRFKKQGYDKSENLRDRLIWREANDELKEGKIYREHLDNLLEKVN